MHRLAAHVRGLGFGSGIAGAGAGAATGYIGVSPFAYDYDGTNDYAARGADLTGIADGKQGTLSAWVRIDGGDGALRTILTNNTSCSIYLGTDNKFTVAGTNAAVVTILDIRASAILAGTAWRHFLSSWDLADAGKRHLYVNDVSDLSVVTYTNDTIDYTRPDWGFGGFSAGTNKFNGCISETFFHTTYIDLSVEANRRKFITAAGKPASLGADGSSPLGVQPLLYAPTGDASNNKGSGGNFTVTGTLDAASTTPF